MVWCMHVLCMCFHISFSCSLGGTSASEEEPIHVADSGKKELACRGVSVCAREVREQDSNP